MCKINRLLTTGWDSLVRQSLFTRWFLWQARLGHSLSGMYAYTSALILRDSLQLGKRLKTPASFLIQQFPLSKRCKFTSLFQISLFCTVLKNISLILLQPSIGVGRNPRIANLQKTCHTVHAGKFKTNSIMFGFKRIKYGKRGEFYVFYSMARFRWGTRSGPWKIHPHKTNAIYLRHWEYISYTEQSLLILNKCYVQSTVYWSFCKYYFIFIYIYNIYKCNI